MVIGLIGGAILGLGGWLAGKSGGGGGVDLFRGVELFTKKEETMITSSYQSTYSPTITRTYDIQYIIGSPSAQMITKKEQAITQTPTVSPQIITIPTQLQGAGEIGGAGGGSGEMGIDWLTIAIIGGGAWYLFGRKKK